MLTIIEKVISLQSVDVFSEVSTQQLSHLAAIAREVTFPKGETIYQEQGRADAMYRRETDHEDIGNERGRYPKVGQNCRHLEP